MHANNNPFRRSEIAKLRYKLNDVQMHALTSLLQKHHYSGVILGPHGTGKSTLLEDLQSRLTDLGRSTQYLRLHRESPKQEKRQAIKNILLLPKDSILFLDGGENLGWLRWLLFSFQLRWNKVSVIATVHYPCPLPTLFRTRKDTSLMLKLTQQLAGEFWSPYLKNLALKTYRQNNGNMREVFRACYLNLALDRFPPTDK